MCPDNHLYFFQNQATDACRIQVVDKPEDCRILSPEMAIVQVISRKKSSSFGGISHSSQEITHGNILVASCEINSTDC
jgi:hypothetical protein